MQSCWSSSPHCQQHSCTQDCIHHYSLVLIGALGLQACSMQCLFRSTDTLLFMFRHISHLLNGEGCIMALQSTNANHTWRLKKAIPDVFLLHLGAMMGETPALEALKVLGRNHNPGSPSALFGGLEESGSWENDWSQPVVKSRPGITFKMSKRRWSRGLFLYKTTTSETNFQFL